MTTDIIGKADAHSVRLDKEAGDAVKKAGLHRKVATTIFFESNGGMSQAKADATVPEIKTDVFGPDTNLADLDNVLEGLASTCYYLNWDRNRYRFGLSPNLNQILVSRRGAVQLKVIEERIRQQTQKLFDKHTADASKLIDRKYWPARSNDVPSRPMLTLVVMGLDTQAGEKKTTELMESIVRDCGSSGRTFKSALIFAVPDSCQAVREAARNALAWEDIDDDEDTKKRIDEGQKSLLARNLKNAQRDLDEAIFRTYRHVYLLGKDNKPAAHRPGPDHVQLGRKHRRADSPRTPTVRGDHRRHQPGQADQVLAPSPCRMVHEGCAGCILLVPPTIAVAEPRLDQTDDQRRRDATTARVCDQGCGRPVEAVEIRE